MKYTNDNTSENIHTLPFSDHEPEKKKHSLNFVYRVFCWCSGARLYLLNQCPTEYNKHFGIGTIIVFTGALAFISGSYAFYTIFNTPIWSVTFGLFWGLLIFFLDWYIVASIRKENKFKKEFVTAFPRLLLSVFLAIVITKPLELKIFEKEINQEIATIKTDKTVNSNVKIFEEYTEIGVLEEEIQQLNQQINNYEKRRNNLYNAIIAEAEGRSPTSTAGKGPVYREKKQEFDKTEKLYQTIKKQNNPLINQKRAEIDKLRQQRNKAMQQQKQTIENYEGLLARLQALGALTQKNKYINIANWFIILLFIIIESSPILVKLMAKKGPYDYLLDLEEFKKNSHYYHQKSLLRNQISQDINQNNSNYETEDTLKTEVLTNYAANLKQSIQRINKAQISKWEKSVMQKVNKSTRLQDFIGKIKLPKH